MLVLLINIVLSTEESLEFPWSLGNILNSQCKQNRCSKRGQTESTCHLHPNSMNGLLTFFSIQETSQVRNLTGSHAAVGEVVAGEDLILIHLCEHPGLPQVRDQDAWSHPQGDPVAVVVNQFPQFLLAHLSQVWTLRNTLPCHLECVVCGFDREICLLLRRWAQLE